MLENPLVLRLPLSRWVDRERNLGRLDTPRTAEAVRRGAPPPALRAATLKFQVGRQTRRDFDSDSILRRDLRAQRKAQRAVLFFQVWSLLRATQVKVGVIYDNHL